MNNPKRRLHFTETAALISKAAQASRKMTPLQRLEIIVKAGLVTEQDAEKAKERFEHE